MAKADRTVVPEPTTGSYAIAQLVDRMVTLTFAIGEARDLRPSQWAALRYFEEAEASARTIKRFAQHNQTTVASASQTVATLTNRNLITSRPSPVDGRSRLIEVTPAGRAVLEQDPLKTLARLLDDLGRDEIHALRSAIDTAYRRLEDLAGAP